MDCHVQKIASRQQMIAEPHFDLAVGLQCHPRIRFDLHIGAVTVDTVLPKDPVPEVALGGLFRFYAMIFEPQGDLVTGAEHILGFAVLVQQGGICKLYLTGPQTNCRLFTECRQFLLGELFRICGFLLGRRFRRSLCGFFGFFCGSVFFLAVGFFPFQTDLFHFGQIVLVHVLGNAFFLDQTVLDPDTPVADLFDLSHRVGHDHNGSTFCLDLL